jgi:GST-like protein
MIDLYTAPTPNGHKASCTLEALELDYKTHFVNISEGEQKLPDYLAISPNGRIPAIVDNEAGGLPIFESGAIMIYLAEKTGRLMPTDVQGRSKVIQWLMFQMGGLADNYSIADIANWCWVRTYRWSGVSRDGLENLDRWMSAMKEQPGMSKGIDVPFSLGNLLSDKKDADEFAQNAQKLLQK